MFWRSAVAPAVRGKTHSLPRGEPLCLINLTPTTRSLSPYLPFHSQSRPFLPLPILSPPSPLAVPHAFCPVGVSPSLHFLPLAHLPSASLFSFPSYRHALSPPPSTFPHTAIYSSPLHFPFLSSLTRPRSCMASGPRKAARRCQGVTSRFADTDYF